MKVTNSQLAEKLNIPLSKIRRWTKEFLPPDPIATRRSGYKKHMSLNDAFEVILGGKLVSDFGFSFYEARQILKELKTTIVSSGLLPEIPEGVKLRGFDKEILNYSIRILVGATSTRKFDYQLIGEPTRPELVYETDAVGRKHVRLKETTRIFFDITSPGLLEAISQDPKPYTIKILRISEMLGTFIIGILNNGAYEQWLDKREQLKG